nr:DUF6382 domain-containing protein [Paenibacillus lemnae]
MTRDFVQDNGTFMVLCREERLDRSEISEVQMGMIRAVKMPHFLPLFLKEMDFNITLEYNITGKKMLAQALKTEKLSLTECYALLLQVITTLEDSSKYLLRAEQYILDENYMFMEGSIQSGMVYLTYLPLVQGASLGDQGLGSGIRDLLTRLLTSIRELKGNGIQTLIQFCGREDFNLGGLKTLLLELMAEDDGDIIPNTAKAHHPQPEHVQPQHMQPQRGAQKHVQPPHIQPKEAVSTDSVLNQDNVRSGSTPPFQLHTIQTEIPAKPSHHNRGWFPPPENLDDDWGGDALGELEEEGEESPARIYWLLGGLLGMAAIWRFLYMSSPGTAAMMISAAASVVVGVISFLGWKGKMRHAASVFTRPQKIADEDSGSLDFQEARSGKFRFQMERLTGLLSNRAGSSPSSTPVSAHRDSSDLSKENWRWGFPPSQHDDVEASDSQAGDSFRRQGDHYSVNTEIASAFAPADAGTVLLQPQREPGAGSMTSLQHKPSPYLEVSLPSQREHERVELRQAHFIIGRSEEVAQYVAASSGISRAHVELFRSPEGYRIKDLGSKNGTLLKGEPMIAYKDYPLEEGDVFVIAGGQYTFRAS